MEWRSLTGFQRVVSLLEERSSGFIPALEIPNFDYACHRVVNLSAESHPSLTQLERRVALHLTFLTACDTYLPADGRPLDLTLLRTNVGR